MILLKSKLKYVYLLKFYSFKMLVLIMLNFFKELINILPILTTSLL